MIADPTDADVVMLCTDPHPAHRGFAERVGAELVDFRHRNLGALSESLAGDVVNGLTYPDADVYLVEGSQPLYAALVARARTGARVVYLCADHGLYSLGRGDFGGQSPLKTLVGRFGRSGVRAAGRWGIDGVVAVSEFAAGFVRPFVGEGTPVRIAHPYVQPEVYDRLLGVTPELDATVAVTVGRGDRYKGVDRLAAAWPAVRERHPDAELHVVGSGHPEYERAGVAVHGFVDDLPAALARAGLFVQPSRMDTFPVSTLEAMCAGLPPLVTEGTGTRSEACALDPSLVVDGSPESLARGVAEYFHRPVEERRTLGAAARGRGRTFDKESRCAAFRRAFYDVTTSFWIPQRY